MTDHAARAVELTTHATDGINANHSTPDLAVRQTLALAGVAEAILALADATLVDRTDFDTYRRCTWAEHVARRTSQRTSQPTSYFPAQQMMSAWHAASDHAEDGEPFGGPLCNCERVVARVRSLGWGPVQRPRWDDDLRPDHPEIVTERGQERPNAPARGAWACRAGTTPQQAHSHFDWTWEPTCSGCGYLKAQDPATGAWIHKMTGKAQCETERTPDPTFDNPITVHGIPAEDHHAHVCPVCRRVREEKP